MQGLWECGFENQAFHKMVGCSVSNQQGEGLRSHLADKIALHILLHITTTADSIALKPSLHIIYIFFHTLANFEVIEAQEEGDMSG